MATQTIEFSAPTGETITAKLYTAGSDTVAATASSVTEQTNRKGVYYAVVTSSLAGVYRLIATDASNTPLATWWVTLADANDTYIAYETPDAGSITAARLAALDTVATSANQTIIIDRVSYSLTALVGACSDAGTAAETYTLSIGGSTFTVDHSGLDATGNRGTVTLTKV